MTVAWRTIARQEWRTFFDHVSKAALGKRAELEAISLELGDQVIAERVPLLGVTFDSHDDAIEIALGGLTHRVHAPRDIAVHEGPYGIGSIAVVAGDGAKHVLRLTTPLMFPAPGSTSV